MLIGLTGGIATGKSTVAAILRDNGAAIVDADSAAREIVLPGQPALEEIAAVFGQAVIHADGTLNRQALGAIIFADKEARQRLDRITHPRIREYMQTQIVAYKKEGRALIVADIPLLYETGQESAYEGVLVVYVPAQLQLERLMARNSLSEQEARKRLASQMDIEQKKQRATWVIDNSGTEEHTRERVLIWLQSVQVH